MKINIIAVTGLLLILIITSSIIPYFQDVIALSLGDTVNKLFGGFFHKHQPNQTLPTQTQQTHQSLNNMSNTTSSSSSSAPLSSMTSKNIPSGCHIVNGNLPDPKCTPGAINPNVTQNNIKDTICVPGFSKTIRPPVSYTNPLKIKLMHSYGFTDSRINYELDHLVPLSIGGNPSSVTNLWPEPGYGQYNFHIKDRFENYLYREVCNGHISLDEAQNEIASNWLERWKKAGQP